VDEAVDAAEVDEHAERRDRADVPVTFWPTCRLLNSSSRFSRRSS
jgi:hypothetical protein